MSQASRAVALQNAVALAVVLGTTLAETLDSANLMNAFLNADEAPAATVEVKTTLVKGTAAVAADKAAAAKKATPATVKKPAKTEEQLAAEVAASQAATEAAQDAGDDLKELKERAGKATADLLAANLRDKAVGLFKKYGAKSVSSVPEDKLAAFIDEAEGLLLSA